MGRQEFSGVISGREADTGHPNFFQSAEDIRIPSSAKSHKYVHMEADLVGDRAVNSAESPRIDLSWQAIQQQTELRIERMIDDSYGILRILAGVAEYAGKYNWMSGPCQDDHALWLASGNCSVRPELFGGIACLWIL